MLLNRETIAEAISASLVEFGYPSCTPAMVAEAYDDWKAKKPVRHGVIGQFAVAQFEELEDSLEEAGHNFAEIMKT